MQQKFTDNEKVLVIILTVFSITAYIPVIYALHRVHKHRGFEIMVTIGIMLSQMLYKSAAVLNDDVFLNQD